MPITAQVEKITPAHAKEILGGNTHNRNVTAAYITALAEAMRRGEFRTNGEAVKLAQDGTVLDGQARLLAVIESGKTLTTLVVRGLRLEDQDTMDVGRKRRFADVLHMRGEKDCNNLASTLTYHFRLTNGNPRHNTTATFAQLTEHLAEHPGLRDAIKTVTPARQRLHVAGAPLAALAYEFATLDQEDCDTFFQSLTDGVDLDRDDPILRLREALVKAQDRQGNLRGWWLQAMTIKAWSAWRSGDTIALLSFRGGGAHPEAWPTIK
jgi:hypothetical protein